MHSKTYFWYTRVGITRQDNWRQSRSWMSLRYGRYTLIKLSMLSIFCNWLIDCKKMIIVLLISCVHILINAFPRYYLGCWEYSLSVELLLILGWRGRNQIGNKRPQKSNFELFLFTVLLLFFYILYTMVLQLYTY